MVPPPFPSLFSCFSQYCQPALLFLAFFLLQFPFFLLFVEYDIAHHHAVISQKEERLNNSMKVLIQCKKEYISPKFLRLKVSFYQNRRVSRILESASRRLLIERISEIRRERNMFVQKCKKRLSRLLKVGKEEERKLQHMIEKKVGIAGRRHATTLEKNSAG
jgi:hypothetical protein